MTKDTVLESSQFKKELISLAVPLALQNLLNAMVGASDALMLGRLNQNAIAAVSLANQISFIMSLFNGSVIGAAGVLIAQYWGKQDSINARRFLGMAIRYVTVISLLFFVMTFSVPDWLMGIFTQDNQLIRIGADYLRIVSFSYLFAGISQCFLMMMKVTDYAKMSVWISAVTVIVDMVIDFFLIYGIGPFPALGANGSAYSTIAVEAIALAWCLVWAQGKNKIRMEWKTLLFFPELMKKMSGRLFQGYWQAVFPGVLV